ARGKMRRAAPLPHERNEINLALRFRGLCFGAAIEFCTLSRRVFLSVDTTPVLQPTAEEDWLERRAGITRQGFRSTSISVSRRKASRSTTAYPTRPPIL